MNKPPESTTQAAAIDNVGEFLAHALELEQESATHYQQLADSMAIHHNQDVAALFHRLARLSDEHAARIGARAHDVHLPRIAPWEFKWDCPGGPESGNRLHGDISYLMTAVQALELALHNETRGQAFYAHTAAVSADDEVRRLATEMSAEEAEHVNMLRDLLKHEQLRGETAPEDLDPPHMPG
jgi:rubrerythrin